VLAAVDVDQDHVAQDSTKLELVLV